jgi:hypothetical protein
LRPLRLKCFEANNGEWTLAKSEVTVFHTSGAVDDEALTEKYSFLRICCGKGNRKVCIYEILYFRQ